MRGPKPPTVSLTAAERQQLEALARRHGTAQQLALRARIVLAAAAGANNAQIARQWGVAVDTARLWRGRWLGLQSVALGEWPAAQLSVPESGDCVAPGDTFRDSGRRA